MTASSAFLDQTGLLIVRAEYTQDVKGKALIISMITPNTSFTELNSTWTVRPSNQLAAVVYSHDHYDSGRRLQSLAIFIQAAYLLCLILFVLFRKFIGLELATLIQMGYLSLLLNKEITVYLQPITTLQLVFGFSGLHFSHRPS